VNFKKEKFRRVKQVYCKPGKREPGRAHIWVNSFEEEGNRKIAVKCLGKKEG